MPDTLIRPDVTEVVDLEIVPFDDTDSTSNTRTHIVNPPANVHIWQPGMSAQDVVDQARLNGWEVVALCEYRWVPKRNPDKYPMCDDCMRIAGEIMRQNG